MSRIVVNEIFKGLCWVEVAEADLRLCCGCPPDAAKHLKNRGLLWGGEGHAHGPNALLISDALVSGGRVTSFSEFPIMQMLYMQGMLHQPSRRSELPVLMGLRENVDRQMEYLLRGNYGCLTREELRQSGCDEALAEQLYSIKLWFAEEQVLDKNHLCRPLYLGSDDVEIKNGVTIRRTAFDKFQVSFRGEQVTVDLAGDDKVRPLPYSLVNHRFQWVDFGILHSGEGNGWETGNPCMSGILIHKGKAYAIDAGPGFQEIIGYLGLDIQDIEGLFLTHIHDDHFAGLPDLLQCGHKVKLFATPQVHFTARKKLSALLSIDEEKFSDFFEVINLAPGEWNEHDELEIFPFFSPHPVETNAFWFKKKTSSGFSTYSHLADTISFENLEKLGKHGRGVYDERQLAVLKETYTRYADVKKVDVGGGLIHGVKNDYQKDTSKKIVFSHSHQPQVLETGIISQRSCFGELDVLSPGDSQDLMAKRFSQTLTQHFPSLAPGPVDEILKISEWLTLSRGEVFRVEKDYCAALLNGNMRVKNVSFRGRIMVARGAILGLKPPLDGVEEELVVGTSFVRLLKFPREVLLKKIEHDPDWRQCQAKSDHFNLLNRLLLSKHFYASDIVVRLCACSEEVNLTETALLAGDDLHDLYLLVQGKGAYLSHDKKRQEIKPGDFFGGNDLFTTEYGQYEMEVETDAKLIRIPAPAFKNIPLIWWMIYENCSTLNHLCKIS